MSLAHVPTLFFGLRSFLHPQPEGFLLNNPANNFLLNNPSSLCFWQSKLNFQPPLLGQPLPSPDQGTSHSFLCSSFNSSFFSKRQQIWLGLTKVLHEAMLHLSWKGTQVKSRIIFTFFMGQVILTVFTHHVKQLVCFLPFTTFILLKVELPA